MWVIDGCPVGFQFCQPVHAVRQTVPSIVVFCYLAWNMCSLTEYQQGELRDIECENVVDILVGMFN